MNKLLDWLDGASSPSDLRYEINQARAIREWALAQLNVSVGDQVRIAVDLNINGQDSWGWMPSKEALAKGATATVVSIDFNQYCNDGAGAWQAGIRLDREWSTGSTRRDGSVTRYWCGPAAETPEGYEPPSPYDQEKYPQGRRHTFAMQVHKLERVAASHPVYQGEAT